MFSPTEMFGLSSNSLGKDDDDDDNDDDDATEECLICLTEQKEVLLLPCKHFCVCSDCFVHLDKCPVCRASFDKYVVIEKNAPTEIIHIPKCSDVSVGRFEPRVVENEINPVGHQHTTQTVDSSVNVSLIDDMNVDSFRGVNL